MKDVFQSKPTEESQPDVEVVPASSAPPKTDQPQRITIVNKIPPTLVNVLKQQFKLMEGWMEPILKSQTQTTEIQDLKDRLDRCLADYSKLIERVGKSKK